MTVAHPIARAWISTGGPQGRTTGSQNYDEFADDAEITEIIAANPASALGVEMPHLAPDSLGTTFTAALPAAVRRLADAKADGRYRSGEGLAVLYRITGGDEPAYGLWCMVDTDQISTSADEPGLVIRNEDVFVEKVRERVELAEATGHLLSPVLLLQTGQGERLHAALAEVTAAAGEPACADRDQAGRLHEIWPVPPGVLQERLLGLAGGGEMVVADGNHRSLAAQTAGLRRFLAVVTTPASVAIQPYNRLVRDVEVAGLADGLRDAGAAVEPLRPRLGAPGTGPGPGPGAGPVAGGVVHLYTRDGAWAVRLPGPDDGSVVDGLDHALVERLLLGGALDLEPGDKRITYVGGDYPDRWLVGEVDAGRADLAVLIAPVTVEDFVAVNLARLKMPRKSTWFTPKARAGLVLAELG
jgi:uncharacterized protein (DUF1015 family)